MNEFQPGDVISDGRNTFLEYDGEVWRLIPRPPIPPRPPAPPAQPIPESASPTPAFTALAKQVTDYIAKLKEWPYSDAAKYLALEGFLGRICGVDKLLKEADESPSSIPLSELAVRDHLLGRVQEFLRLVGEDVPPHILRQGADDLLEAIAALYGGNAND